MTEWKIDFSDIQTMKEYRAVRAEWLAILSSGNFEAIYVFMAKRVKSWEFAGNPEKVLTYDTLKPWEYNAANEKVSRALAALFQRPADGDQQSDLQAQQVRHPAPARGGASGAKSETS